MEETEPRVVTEDLRAVLLEELAHTAGDQGETVALLAEKAGTSTRTVYRILGRRTKATDLALADRLLIAAGRHLHEVSVVFPDGTIEPPVHVSL